MEKISYSDCPLHKGEHQAKHIEYYSWWGERHILAVCQEYKATIILYPERSIEHMAEPWVNKQLQYIKPHLSL